MQSIIKVGALMKRRVITLVGPESNELLLKGAHKALVMKLRTALEVHDVPSVFIGDGEAEVSIKQIKMSLENIHDPHKPTTVIIFSHGKQKQDVHYIELRDDELDSTCNILKIFSDKFGSNVDFFIIACESEGALTFGKNMLGHSIVALSRVGEQTNRKHLSLWISSLIHTPKDIDFRAESLLDYFLCVLDECYSPVIGNSTGVNVLSGTLENLLKTGISDSQKTIVHQSLDGMLGIENVNQILKLISNGKAIRDLDFGIALLVAKVLRNKIIPYAEFFPAKYKQRELMFDFPRSRMDQREVSPLNYAGRELMFDFPRSSLGQSATFISLTPTGLSDTAKSLNFRLDADLIHNNFPEHEKVLAKPDKKNYCGFKSGFFK